MAATFAAVRAQAASQIGYNGTGSLGLPHSKFGVWYGADPNPWCAMFVSWCFAAAGGALHIETPKGFAYCPSGAAYFKRAGRWHGPNITPQPGDLVFFDFDRIGEPHHVGLVEAATGTSKITSIQGNTDDPSIGRGGNCCRRKVHTNRNVFGYGRPVYPNHPQPLPLAPGVTSYLVRAGDTLSAIAKRLLGNAARYREIATLNHLADPNKIFIGQVLRIPPR